MVAAEYADGLAEKPKTNSLLVLLSIQEVGLQQFNSHVPLHRGQPDSSRFHLEQVRVRQGS